MKERPILFSGPMVRAILERRQTQTRRPVKPQPRGLVRDKTASMASIFHWPHGKPQEIVCPYGVPGDRLWVRETFLHTRAEYEYSVSTTVPYLKAETIYAADVDG